jgi:hypothetical protein
MKYEILIFIAMCLFFVTLFTYLTEPHSTIPKDFHCTESAIVNGQAECVKYEREEE